MGSNGKLSIHIIYLKGLLSGKFRVGVSLKTEAFSNKLEQAKCYLCRHKFHEKHSVSLSYANNTVFQPEPSQQQHYIRQTRDIPDRSGSV